MGENVVSVCGKVRRQNASACQRKKKMEEEERFLLSSRLLLLRGMVCLHMRLHLLLQSGERIG